jgi:hypothetical protein
MEDIKSHKAAAVNAALRLSFSRPWLISAVAAGMLLLWMVVHLLAAAPQLHHEVHADAASKGHHCLWTELASGAIEPAVVPVSMAGAERPTAFTLPAASNPAGAQECFPPHAARPPPTIASPYFEAGS